MLYGGVYTNQELAEYNGLNPYFFGKCSTATQNYIASAAMYVMS